MSGKDFCFKLTAQIKIIDSNQHIPVEITVQVRDYSYVDKNVQSGKCYYYTLKANDQE